MRRERGGVAHADPRPGATYVTPNKITLIDRKFFHTQSGVGQDAVGRFAAGSVGTIGGGMSMDAMPIGARKDLAVGGGQQRRGL